MGFIFLMSAQNAYDSGNSSGSILNFIIGLFDKNFKFLSENEKLIIIDKYQFFIRKTAHFTIYAALGCFWFGFFSTFNRFKKHFLMFFSLLCTFFYAITDEIHQSFVPGRSGQITDVLIDTFGGLAGVLVMYLILKCVKIWEVSHENRIKR